MSYRDELGATQALVASLKQEIAEREREIERLKAQTKKPSWWTRVKHWMSPVTPLPPEPAPPSLIPRPKFLTCQPLARTVMVDCGTFLDTRAAQRRLQVTFSIGDNSVPGSPGWISSTRNDDPSGDTDEPINPPGVTTQRR